MPEDIVTVGIDASLTGTGVAVKRGSVIMVETIKTTPDAFENDLARMIHIRNTIMAKMPNDVKLVCIEDFFTGMHAGSGIRLAMLGAIIRVAMYEKGIAFLIVAPTSLKKWILGKGVGEKNLILREVYRKLGMSVENDNEADGVVLAHLAEQLHCELTGIPYESPKYQQEVIKNLLKSRAERGFNLPPKPE